MENSTLTRKEREKIRHKSEIINSALDLFSEKGFHNVSMQDIAVRSEYAVGTLYNFFQSKEQLFEELRNDCANKILQILVPILESDQPEKEKIQSFVMHHLEFAEQNLKFIKVYVAEHGTLTVSEEAHSMQVKKILKEKMFAVLNSGIEAKVFKPVDVEIYILALFASLQSFIMESSKNYDHGKVKCGLENLGKLFLSVLVNE
jgi:AcrR family transcriptional regulator